jgi:hypothetical protein
VASPPSATASAANGASAASPRFDVVDLLDLQRRPVSRFAYCPSTEELFVSFDGDRALQQWSVPAARLVHTYPVERGFMVDALSPSPDGRLLVAGLFRVEDGASPHSEKYALLDVARHAPVSLDLGIHDDRNATIDFGASGQRFRVRTSASMGGPGSDLVYDTAGQTATAPAAEFPPKPRGRLHVVESSKATIATHGLYYTDAEGHDTLVTRNHWHDNYGLTRDGQYVVATTWDGEILAFSTATKAVVFTRKIAQQYGYLAYDEKHDRFLIADAVFNGTSTLRALVRVAP